MNKRPVFLNLLQIKFPVTAIVSIGHRVSGVLMIVVLPFWIWMLQETLGSAESYANLVSCIDEHSFVKSIIFLSIISVWYHVFAGFRHLVMDLGFGESMKKASVSAWVVLMLTFFAAVFLFSVFFE